jgi:hypothetical protein
VARKRRELKDRLIQTRVPENLESTLKEEAQKRRLSVSHLIRNVLEDTFNLVGTVVAGAERIAENSVEVAEKVAEDAGRIADVVRQAHEDVRGPRDRTGGAHRTRGGRVGRDAPPPVPEKPLIPDDVIGWNQLAVHRPARCHLCEKRLDRGVTAHLAFKATPSGAPLWLCAECFETLPEA